MTIKFLATAMAALIVIFSVVIDPLTARANEAEAIDGTLPLRLPSDGTLPLKLIGRATAMSGSLPALNTEILITRAVRTSLSPALGNALRCQQPERQISKHAAAGTVKIGNSAYAIKGICYNHSNKNMEVVAERIVNATHVERSFMIGLLPTEQPQRFQGRLHINSDTGNSHRYAFSTQRHAPQ